MMNNAFDWISALIFHVIYRLVYCMLVDIAIDC